MEKRLDTKLETGLDRTLDNSLNSSLTSDLDRRVEDYLENSIRPMKNYDGLEINAIGIMGAGILVGINPNENGIEALGNILKVLMENDDYKSGDKK